jgi:hypothetical protein
MVIYQFKNLIKEAYKKHNIPRLNDISNTLLDLIYENEQFRIRNRHLEPQPLYSELSQYVNLYSQNLRLISKLEFTK